MTAQMTRLLNLASGTLGAPDNIYGSQIIEARRMGWIAGQEPFTKAGGNRKTRYFITEAGRIASAEGR